MSIFAGIAARAAGFVMPSWAPWAAAALVGMACTYGVGRVQEARIGAAALVAYQEAQVAQTVTIIQKQIEVVTKTEVVYRDRIKKIYVQGVTIEADIPKYITPADTDQFRVNAGFVRVVDAAWTGDPVGPAVESDHGPADVPLDEVAAAQVHNATTSRAWREQALLWRDFYARQQIAINGKPGPWATEVLPLER